MIDKTYLESVCAAQSLPFSPELSEKLDQYAQLLVEWNEKMNLTAITEPNDIAVKHFADSLLLLNALDIPKNASLIDVGTGAGFPSVPVGLARPDLKVTLLDSLQKRITFLEILCAQLSLPAVCVHGRAEEMGRQAAFRERFDVATARAVANLRELAEYCLPFVKVGGTFAALKGYDIEGVGRSCLCHLPSGRSGDCREEIPTSGRRLPCHHSDKKSSTRFRKISSYFRKNQKRTADRPLIPSDFRTLCDENFWKLFPACAILQLKERFGTEDAQWRDFF